MAIIMVSAQENYQYSKNQDISPLRPFPAIDSRYKSFKPTHHKAFTSPFKTSLKLFSLNLF